MCITIAIKVVFVAVVVAVVGTVIER